MNATSLRGLHRFLAVAALLACLDHNALAAAPGEIVSLTRCEN